MTTISHFERSRELGLYVCPACADRSLVVRGLAGDGGWTVTCGNDYEWPATAGRGVVISWNSSRKARRGWRRILSD